MELADIDYHSDSKLLQRTEKVQYSCAPVVLSAVFGLCFFFWKEEEGIQFSFSGRGGMG